MVLLEHLLLQPELQVQVKLQGFQVLMVLLVLQEHLRAHQVLIKLQV
jgi:hypothetical protein